MSLPYLFFQALVIHTLIYTQISKMSFMEDILIAATHTGTGNTFSHSFMLCSKDSKLELRVL